MVSKKAGNPFNFEHMDSLEPRIRFILNLWFPRSRKSVQLWILDSLEATNPLNLEYTAS